MVVWQQNMSSCELAFFSIDKRENIQDSIQSSTLKFYPAKISNLLLNVYSVDHLPSARA